MDNSWKQTCLFAHMKVSAAMETLEETSKGIILVTDNESHLLGTITDGDVRRALLGGHTLAEPIGNIMNTDPYTGSPNHSDLHMDALSIKHTIRSLPIVDKQKKVVGLFQADSIRKPLPNQVFLMAGGLGARMRPLTNSYPKPLLEVGGQAILATAINNLKRHKLTQINICVYYKKNLIVDYFGNGKEQGVNINYINEEKPLGTAGVIGIIDPRPTEPFLVINGDILTKLNFTNLLEFHNNHSSPLTICVTNFSYSVPYGVVETNGQALTRLNEKPKTEMLINAGIYVLDPSVCDLSDGPTDMTEIIQKLIKEGNSPSVFFIHEYWADIGQIEDLERARKIFSNTFN